MTTQVAAASPPEASVPAAAARLAALPPTFFAIAFGSAGLAVTWRTATPLLDLPGWIADALFIAAAVVWVVLMAGLLLRLVRSPGAVVAQLTDPTLSPFMAVPPIVAMLLAVGLWPHAPGAAKVVAMAALAVTVALGGWLGGQWIAGDIDAARVHPAYFLPVVAGGLVGANAMGMMGHRSLGWASMGIGVIGWMQIGPVILGRLFTGPGLPAALVPTLAIEAAPPAVAGNAYLALHLGSDDLVVYGLAGFCALSVVAQLRLFGLYRRLAFAPGFWAFVFSYTAVATFALQLIERERPGSASLLGWLVLGTITAFVGVVVVQSARAIATWHGRAMPAPTVERDSRSLSGYRSKEQS